MLDHDSHIDFSSLWEVKIKAETWDTKVKFGDITYGRILVINDGVVHIHGKVHLMASASDMVWHTSYFQVRDSKSIMIGDTGSIMASYI